MLVAALKSRYFRHRCYRCFLHSVSSVTINEVTDQSGAGVVAMAFLLGEHAGCYGDFARFGIGITRHMDYVICPWFMLSGLIITLKRKCNFIVCSHVRIGGSYSLLCCVKYSRSTLNRKTINLSDIGTLNTKEIFKDF